MNENYVIYFYIFFAKSFNTFAGNIDITDILFIFPDTERILISIAYLKAVYNNNYDIFYS